MPYIVDSSGTMKTLLCQKRYFGKKNHIYFMKKMYNYWNSL